MKIRVEGTRAEVNAVVAVLRQVLDVQEDSAFYPNRRSTVLGRVYLTVAAPTTTVVRARAERITQRDEIERGTSKEITS